MICRYLPFLVFTVLLMPLSPVLAMPKWDDVFYSSGPNKGSNKIWMSKMTAEQRAFYQERYRDEINYCLQNIGKSTTEVDPDKGCCAGSAGCEYAPISYYTIAAKYLQEYKDPLKGAEYSYKFWLDNPKGEILDGEAPTDAVDIVIWGYENAGMYKESLPFYDRAYVKLMGELKANTDIKLLKSNFKEYEKRWPGDAEEYLSFMRNWKKAKKLAKTGKPKSLEPAVQNHEWFYSDKQEEVLKALEYYYANKVDFMLEKALAHKDKVVAGKAKEYLDKLKAEKNQPEIKEENK